MEAAKIIKTLSLILLLCFLTLIGKAESDEDSYSQIASAVMPSVVTILVYDYSGALKHVGSGFFYNQNGDIVTNSHVLPGNTRAEIKLVSGEKFSVGAVIERNETTDVVKARTHLPRQSPFLKTAARHPAVGDRIMVAGSPMGLEQTLTEGIVSAWRKLPEKGYVLQISAPVSPGSSGGPVLNMAGEVVGIAAFQMVQGQNLNFAVPVDVIFGKPASPARKLNFYKNKDGVTIIE